MAKKDDLGRLGEQLAVDYLAERGYAILERNWRSGCGEIDIVALHDNETVFIEVKTRSSVAYGNPLDAITPAKHARLRQLVHSWLDAESASSGRIVDTRGAEPRGRRTGFRVRIDAIGIVLQPTREAIIDHVIGIA